MQVIQGMKEGFDDFLQSIAEGWRRLRQQAAGALTHFRPGQKSVEVSDDLAMPSPAWALLAGDVYEDEKKITVRLEVPGMDKDDIKIEVRDNALIVSGEKRFERESESGRYRVLQCAYGSFDRVVPLPAAVLADQTKASYKNGVLKIELPKAQPGKSNRVEIRVV